MICFGLVILIWSIESLSLVRAERISPQHLHRDYIYLKSFDKYLARQQINATPYPNADALKPEVQFEEGNRGTQETQESEQIPDPVYGPPEPDLTYGPPSPAFPTPLTKQLPLDQLPSENEPVDFIAPLLFTSGELTSNVLPDIQVTPDNYYVGNGEGDLLLDSKQSVPVFYTDDFAATPWSWFPSNTGSYNYAYFHRTVPSNVGW